jgi:MOSC domain-containing protein YiiM
MKKFLQVGKAMPPGGNKTIGLRKNPIVGPPSLTEAGIDKNLANDVRAAGGPHFFRPL